MGSNKEKRALSRLLRDTIVNLCKMNNIYNGSMEVDGLICISGQKEGQEVIIKVHEKITCSKSPVKGLYDPPPGVSDIYNNNRSDAYLSKNEPEVYDLSSNKSYNSHEDYNNDYEMPSAKRFRTDESEERSRNATPAVDEQEQAEDLSSTASNTVEDLSTCSPSSVTNTPEKYTYLGKTPYLSSPFHLQKKTPLKPERWTPSTTIPTTPECRACGFTFENFDVLSEHNEAVHSVFTCQSCYKTFTSRSNLERHSRLHTGFKPYMCAICNKAFSRKDHLSNHAAKHAFKCGICNKRFADKNLLATHFSYDHDSVITNICEYCNKGFPSANDYEEHVKTHPQYHAVQRSYKSAPSSPSANNNKQRKYDCTSCTFTCLDKLSLLKHRLTHAESPICFTCLSCAKMFSDPFQYTDHMMSHEEQRNIFECLLCRQIMPTFEGLKRHELLHVQDDDAAESALFSCQLCDVKCTSASDLQEHVHITHKDTSKRHRCSYCNLGFHSYAELCHHQEELRHYAPPSGMVNENTNGDSAREPDEISHDGGKDKSQENGGHFPEENDIGSDIEVVEPEAPEDDVMSKTQTNGDDNPAYKPNEYVVSENPTNVIEIVPTAPEATGNGPQGDDYEIKNQPLRSLLSSKPSMMPQKFGIKDERQRRRKASPEKFSSISSIPEPMSYPDYPDPLGFHHNSPIPFGGAIPAFLGDFYGSSPFIPKLKLKMNDKPDKEPSPMLKAAPPPAKLNIDIPPGPYTCSVCSDKFDNFHSYESHCSDMHKRCPCMFCTKTFAQKANRDRHLCLHTGDKPYSCPDCDEKFSRGDKLKLHRIRSHNIPQSSFPSKGGAGSGGTPSDNRQSGGIGRDMNMTPLSKEWAIASPATTNMSEDDAWSKHESDNGLDWSAASANDSLSQSVHAAGEWSVQPPVPLLEQTTAENGKD